MMNQRARTGERGHHRPDHYGQAFRLRLPRPGKQTVMRERHRRDGRGGDSGSSGSVGGFSGSGASLSGASRRYSPSVRSVRGRKHYLSRSLTVVLRTVRQRCRLRSRPVDSRSCGAEIRENRNLFSQPKCSALVVATHPRLTFRSSARPVTI